MITAREEFEESCVLDATLILAAMNYYAPIRALMPTSVADLVQVTWHDAWVGTTEMETIQDAKLKHKPALMATVGWLLIDDEAGVSVANERCPEEDSYRGRTFIPRALIVSIEAILAPKMRKKRRSKLTIDAAPAAVV